MKNFETKCPKCGELLNIRVDDSEMKTMILYLGEDDNCRIKRYKCKNNHQHNLSIINRNLSTGWIGKKECFCSIKVEEWPQEE